MDTLSSSVSSLNLPSLPPPQLSRELRQFKTTAAAATKSHHRSASTKPTSIISNKTTFSSSITHKTPNFPPSILSSPLKASKSHHIHKNAATGYAAALVSVSQSRNCLQKNLEDVQRLAKFLDGFPEEEERGKIVKEVVERGKYGKYLVGLVRMLVEKGKIGILNEVLDEFERIYDEIVGTKVVWVSSRKKMEEEDLFGIAKKVQKVSGENVKVKVRNLVDQRFALALAI